MIYIRSTRHTTAQCPTWCSTQSPLWLPSPPADHLPSPLSPPVHQFREIIQVLRKEKSKCQIVTVRPRIPLYSQIDYIEHVSVTAISLRQNLFSSAANIFQSGSRRNILEFCCPALSSVNHLEISCLHLTSHRMD